ncbi:hypothetical protein LINPERPRIM_LOCUS16126 [Linum perenne]
MGVVLVILAGEHGVGTAGAVEGIASGGVEHSVVFIATLIGLDDAVALYRLSCAAVNSIGWGLVVFPGH